ncbi:MarR family winged helix-turn-helix transcriptional regulator [Agrobacterium rosae]|uniref:MarR family transcriptional regulator n=1 Tax=Agrobacterium rosae TaxID=1972867 RepID=A0AAE5RXQ8_9HYPH|nr:MarR family transcriptional regulator [Agrobacterium rosae]KAA3514292.1 MarR family transcriptional regulator [Agrobacterium rosae]KAA3522957.1 MarR family transcriptional regulator [Agrobacterium rosae]MCM2433743.1 MarR family transcriptional regulator [Agrobacterium rosae]MDX8329699.1 MarR family transcriptional regulator [Agrobacterium rosae]MQB47660.1 MarR family transcriptional regulator [Agrobacterium rosae]
MNAPTSFSEDADTVDRDEVLNISHTMTRMRLMIGRRVIGRMAIAKLAPGLELSHIDVLDIVNRAGGVATVGAIAEAMRLDPSRGSRVVAEMVGRELLKREASQEDGRRSVINITPLGHSILEEMRSAKISIIREVVSDWPSEDIAEFARLFDRFIGRFEKRLAPDAVAFQTAAKADTGR